MISWKNKVTRGFSVQHLPLWPPSFLKKMGLLVKIEILVKIEPFEWSEYVTNVNFLWFNIVGTTKMTNEKAAMHQHRSTGATFVNLHSDKHYSVMTVVLHHHNIMDATHVTMPCNASK